MTPIRCVMTKWGDRPHWEFDGLLLGEDDHGTWLGFPQGTHNARPGYAFDSEVDSVTLVPRSGWYVSTFHAPGIWCDLYVDIATPAVWDGTVLRAVDLDLDVIRMSATPDRTPPPGLTQGPGVVFVDDEDEFEQHRVEYGYPDDVVASARRAADEVRSAVLAGDAPYDGATADAWLAALR